MKLVAVSILAIALTGCADEAATRQRALAEAADHCASEGKQFHFRSVEKRNNSIWRPSYLVLSGTCLGPGDPGYVAPGQAPGAPAPAPGP